MLDADLSVLKYLNAWYNSIFIETGTSESRSTRVKFRNEYTGTIKITKSETGPDSTTQRKPITYVLEQAYPYAIDSVPLQFGSSQITIPASGVLVGEVEIGPGIFTQQWLLPNGKIVEKRDNKVGTGTQPTAR